MPEICDHNRLSTIGSEVDISEIESGGRRLVLSARKGGHTRKTNECRQEESDLNLIERALFAADSEVPIVSVVVDMHDVPLWAWKGGREKISLRLFHGELARRMDLEQAGRTSADLYEGLSYDTCGQGFRVPRGSRFGLPEELLEVNCVVSVPISSRSSAAEGWVSYTADDTKLLRNLALKLWSVPSTPCNAVLSISEEQRSARHGQ